MTGEESPEAWKDERRESYYVSITDMLIGLLFLFIIMLMYFALQLRETTEDLATTEDTRSELLERLADYLHQHNVSADVDLDAGVLRLPDEILFEKGQERPKPAGIAALKVLADGLEVHLPCYSFRSAQPRPDACAQEPHHVEAIFIEGHTDSDPIGGNARIRDNWDLSAVRAANTFRIMIDYRPSLAGFLSEPAGEPNSRPLMSIAGYADQRPVDIGVTEVAKAKNRRIDVRLVMASPKADELKSPLPATN